MLLSGKLTLFLFLLVSILVVPCKKADCNQFKLIPSVALIGEYSENPDDFIYTFSSKLEMIRRTERLKTNASCQYDWNKYEKYEEMDTFDYYYLGSASCKFTERFKAGSEAGYTRDSRDDRDLDETGLTESAVRHRSNFSIFGDYDLSEKTKSTFSCEYEGDEYDDPEYADCDSGSLNLEIAHNLGSYVPLLSGRMNFECRIWDFENADVDNYSITAGATWEITENIHILADFGTRFTGYEFETENGGSLHIEKKDELKPAGQIELKYIGEKTDCRLFFSDTVYAATRKSTIIDKKTLGFVIHRKFAEGVHGRLFAKYFLNRASEISDFDRHSLAIGPRFLLKFTKNITLAADYVYTNQTDEIENTEEKDNKYIINLTFSCPVNDLL